MNNPLSTEIEKKIHHLCDEIASAEGLSAELHEELCTHVEDKLLGYLNGEVALSESDAFVLAREHFGDRMMVREQLAKINPDSLGLLKRLTVPMLFFVPLFFVFGLSISLMYRLPMYLYVAQLVAVTAGCLWGQFRLFRFCRVQEKKGKSISLPRWSLVLVIPMFVLVSFCMGFLLAMVRLWQFTHSDPAVMSEMFFYPRIVGIPCLWIAMIGTIVAWLKHCDIQTVSRYYLMRVVGIFSMFVGVFVTFSSRFLVIPIEASENRYDIPGVLVHENETWKVLFSYHYFYSPGLETMWSALAVGTGTWLAYEFIKRRKHTQSKTPDYAMVKS